MSFFERLKTGASAEWRAYTEHPFTNGLADGSLAEAAFRHYLVQDYLFLTEFARAYALSVYKSPKLADMREAAAGLQIRIMGSYGTSASRGAKQTSLGRRPMFRGPRTDIGPIVV